ncbi:MAG: DUF4350 domain-containing protein [Candidatus Eremiobacteraeota bacterium]|nr:DUF4350 domain-containing protein [Candidatus Eremiobacteraeota bacterium]
MNLRNLPWTEIVVLAIATAILMTIIYFGYRRQQAIAPRYDTFSSYDAHSGGYRAWYELLEREGFRLERFGRRPAFLDSSIGTLIVAPNLEEVMLRTERTQDSTGVPQAIDFDELHKWVRDGGRLIWLTDGNWDRWLDIDANDKGGAHADDAVAIARSPRTDGVGTVSGDGALRIQPGTSLAFTPLIADSVGTIVAERRYGKGSIIVVTDQSLFVNKHIADASNARLAYDLVAGTGGVVAFDEYVHGYVSGMSWWTILPKPVRAALIIVLSGLSLLLIGTALRFGPTARLPENTERTSAEYLSSMAQLLARGRAARKAMRDLIDVTLNQIAVALGLSDQASLAQIARSVQSSENGQARAAQLQELGRLRALNAPTDNDLLRAAQLCASLRKEYSRYGRIGFGRRAAPLWRSA